MSSEDNQSPLPPSFVALYLSPGRSRPNAPRAEIAARYELCEDLATLLMDTAHTQHGDQHLGQADVLQRMHAGLRGGLSAATPGAAAATPAAESTLSSAEARWVTTRLAELLGWPCPPLDGD